jgi:hypothetical protein
MRRVALSLVAVLVLLSAGASASYAGSRHKPIAKRPPVPKLSSCSSIRAHVVAADTQAQVFIALNSFLTHSYYGCVYGSRHIYELGIVNDCESAGAGGCGGISMAGLGGTFVAYEEHLPGLGAGWLEIVRNLRTGRVLRKLPHGAPKSVVVKSDGAIAWIVGTRVATANGPAEDEVYASDSSGTRLLASGPGIEPASLALAGSTVYWTREGHPVSAPLN